jgi:hypothetical protein
MFSTAQSRAMSEHERTEVLYENPLSSPEDVADWTLEGNAAITFPRGRMRMENVDDPDEVDEPHYVHWCPRRFPDGVVVSWKFWPLYEPGLCMLFFAARGRDGESALDPSLDERTGIYSQYFDGDIDTLHVSYFRRNEHGDPKHEVAFQTVNLRKSKGFHLVERGGDPIPSVRVADPPYRIEVLKTGPEVRFSVDGLEVLRWTDDGEHGSVLGGGHIGFRQMAPTIGEYADLTVTAVE